MACSRIELNSTAELCSGFRVHLYPECIISGSKSGPFYCLSRDILAVAGEESISCSEALESPGLFPVPELCIKRCCGGAQECPSEVGLLELQSHVISNFNFLC